MRWTESTRSKPMPERERLVHRLPVLGEHHERHAVPLAQPLEQVVDAERGAVVERPGKQLRDEEQVHGSGFSLRTHVTDPWPDAHLCSPVLATRHENGPARQQLPFFARCSSPGTALDEQGERTRLHSHIPERFAEALYRTVLARPPRTRHRGRNGDGLLHARHSHRAPGDRRARPSSCRSTPTNPPTRTVAWPRSGARAWPRATGTSRNRTSSRCPACWPRVPGSIWRYIDGNHTFDFALLDFWYLDRMSPVGGVVAFNDCAMPAVHKVIKFLLTHRRYVEMDVGLRASYVDYSRVRGAIRRLTRREASDVLSEFLRPVLPEAG